MSKTKIPIKVRHINDTSTIHQRYFDDRISSYKRRNNVLLSLKHWPYSQPHNILRQPSQKHPPCKYTKNIFSPPKNPKTQEKFVSLQCDNVHKKCERKALPYGTEVSCPSYCVTPLETYGQ